MTLNNPEIALPSDSYNHKLTICNFDKLDNNLQEEWLQLRRKYMDSNMDWHVENDYDEYDADPSTIQLIMQNEQGEITAGMRLTPRASIKETLSWTMLPDIPDSVVDDFDGPVWDITRLVPGNINGFKKKLAAFAELFGAGLAVTLPLDENPHWFFATSQAFIKIFKNYGIEFTPIPGTERGSSQLSHAYPVERTTFLVNNNDQFLDAGLSVQRGIARGSQE